jgi:hypothetical protein
MEGRTDMRIRLFTVVTAGLLLGGAASAAAQTGDHEASAEADLDASADVGSDDAADVGGDVAADSSAGPAGAAGRVAGDFGVGGRATLGGIVGAHGRLMLSEVAGLVLTLGVGVTSLDIDSTTDASVTTLTAGLAAHFRMFGWADGHLSFITGLDFQNLRFSSDVMGATGTDASVTSIALGGGLFGEVFLEPYFSIHAEAGVRFALRFGDDIMLPDGNEVLGDGWSFGTANDLAASLGFTFWT